MVQNIRGGESLLGPQCWTPYLLPAGGPLWIDTTGYCVDKLPLCVIIVAQN